MKATRARLLLFAGLSCVPLSASTASHLYRLGRKAERAGKISQAYLYYQEAAAANPKKARYRLKLESLAPQAAQQMLQAQLLHPSPPSTPAPSPPAAPAPETDQPAGAPHVDLLPESGFDSVTEAELAVQRKLLGPRHLELTDTPQDFTFEGDFKQLFSQLAGQLGFELVFDGDYQPGKRLKFHVEGQTPRQAIHEMEAATNSFVVPLSKKLFLVASDTEAKRKDLEQTEIVSVPMPSVISPQEIAELGQAIKQSVGVEKMYWDPHANAVLLKDRVTRVDAAQAVLEQLTAYRAQVGMELQFIEMDETDMLSLGANLQINSPITFFSTLTSSGAAVTLAQLASLGVGNWFGVTVPSVNVTAMMTSGKAKNLFTSTIVSTDGQKATFHSGEKYPIVSSQYIGSSGPSTSTLSSPAPTITFEDLGIVVNLTPHVHGMDEMSLDLDSEYKVLGTTTNNGIPIIEGRKLVTTVRFTDNQWALVGGLVYETDSKNRSGMPLLSRIPVLSDLVSNYTRNRSKTYVLLAIRPHLLSAPPSERPSREIYVGSDTRSVTPL
jgi:general secretion pathway protein D